MKTKSFIASVFLLAISYQLSADSFSTDKKNDPHLKEQARQWGRNQSIQFLENKGQMLGMDGKPVPFVLFKASVPGTDMYITENGLTYVFIRPEKEHEKETSILSSNEQQLGVGLSEADEKIKVEWARVDMNLQGASIKRENILREAPSVTDFNYFFPHCSKGIYGVKQYEKITIQNIYTGIDWVLYNYSGRGFKYDFIVHPGADPNDIQLVYSSKEPLVIDNKGNLQFSTKLGKITEQAPYSYIKETKQQVESNYRISETKKIEGNYQTTVNYKLSNVALFPKGQTLVIDPITIPILTWGSYYGGNDYDGFNSVITDAVGNVFVTGYMNSPGFPTINPGGGSYFQGAYGGGSMDGFILKFNNAGVLLWATWYGGNQHDRGVALALDGTGNLFVAGTTFSPTIPSVNPGGGAYFQNTNAGGWDSFILKFTSAGALQWATIYGGKGFDQINSIATDLNGNLFVTGYADTALLPMFNPGGGAYFQGANTGTCNAFILQFSNAGALLWATWYGGSGFDVGNSVSTDLAGNIFIVGATNSVNLPTLNPGGGAHFQGAFGGGNSDVFILKFNNVRALQWSTYYGGSVFDRSYSLAVDANGNVFVTGETNSINFPTFNPGGGAFYQPANAGLYDVFILKFNNSGVRQWATYYGGSVMDSFRNDSREKEITVDATGDVFITGYTGSVNFPTLNAGGYFQNTISGAGTSDVFILQFSNSGILKWATYTGSASGDFGTALAIDPNGCLLAIGEWTGSGSNGLFNAGGSSYYDPTWAAIDDSYIMKFCSILSTTTTHTNVPCFGQCTGTATANPINGTAPYTYLWNNSGGQTTQTATGLCAGTYTIIVADVSGATITDTLTITEPPVLSSSVVAANGSCTTQCTGSATVNTNGGTPGYTYSWNTVPVQTNTNATGLCAGNYTCTVTDANGCTDTVSVTIISLPLPTPNITGIDTLCEGDAALLNASGGIVYVWSTGVTGQTVSVIPSSTTTYTVTASDANGCSANSFFTVNVLPAPAAVAASLPAGQAGNVTITQGQSATLSASGGGTYLWNNGMTDTLITVMPSVTTRYCITVTDANGCTADSCVTVTVIPVDCSSQGELYLPNAFSPNGDAENDVLQVYYGNYLCIKDLHLVIYDRWGEKVFETRDTGQGWEGAFKGNKLNTAVFAYHLNATLISGEKIIRKGNISLMK